MDEEELERYVDHLLEDGKLRTRFIPDAVERALYSSVARTVIESTFWLVGKLHGLSFLGVTMVLSRERGPAGSQLRESKEFIDERRMIAVVDRLLANSTINQVRPHQVRSGGALTG